MSNISNPIENASTELLDQEEEHDDNQILSSWENSLEMYKQYHSIEVESDEGSSNAIEASPSDSPPAPSAVHENDDESMKIDEQTTESRNTPITKSTNLEEQTSDQVPPQPGPASPSTPVPSNGPPAAPDPPLPLMEGMDEELKSLLMSWYWAGYYHGLYVGKNNKK